MKTAAMLLAAGRENMMQSARAKELHSLMGRTLVDCTLDAVHPLVDETVVVLGHHAAELAPALPKDVRTVVQDFSLGLGTAKAAQAGLAIMGEADRVLITAADMPMVSTASYARLVEAVDCEACHAAVLYADVNQPAGRDRIIFDGDGNVKRIAPEDTLMPHEEDLNSVNASVYCFSRQILEDGLFLLPPEENGLYRLSALAALLAQKGERVAAVPARDAREVVRIVTRIDLAEAARFLREVTCKRHMQAGVTIIDPATTYIENDVEIGKDTVLYPGVYLERGTRIGQGCVLMSSCHLKRVTLYDDVTLGDCCVLSDKTVPNGTVLPPFSV